MTSIIVWHQLGDIRITPSSGLIGAILKSALRVGTLSMVQAVNTKVFQGPQTPGLYSIMGFGLRQIRRSHQLGCFIVGSWWTPIESGELQQIWNPG